MTVDVILPALDEERALPALLAALPAGYRAIVVDNGSTDGTPRSRPRAVRSWCTSRAAASGRPVGPVSSPPRADVVCFMDADGSFDPRELPRVADPVLRGDADLVLAARRAAPGAWPVHARVANRVLAFELRRRLGLPLHDLGPMRAARRDDLVALGIEDRRSGWPLEMVVLAARAGWRIDETTVAYAPRLGRSKVTGTVRGTARAVADMDRVLRRHTSVLTPRRGEGRAMTRPGRSWRHDLPSGGAATAGGSPANGGRLVPGRGDRRPRRHRGVGGGAPARRHGPHALRGAVLRRLGAASQLGPRPSHRHRAHDRDVRAEGGPGAAVATAAGRGLDHRRSPGASRSSASTGWAGLTRSVRSRYDYAAALPVVRRVGLGPFVGTYVARLGGRADPREEPSAGDGRAPPRPGGPRPARQRLGCRGAHRRDRDRADRGRRHRPPAGRRCRGPRRAAVPGLRPVDAARRDGRRRPVRRGRRVGDRAAGRRDQRGRSPARRRARPRLGRPPGRLALPQLRAGPPRRGAGGRRPPVHPAVPPRPAAAGRGDRGRSRRGRSPASTGSTGSARPGRSTTPARRPIGPTPTSWSPTWRSSRSCSVPRSSRRGRTDRRGRPPPSRGPSSLDPFVPPLRWLAGAAVVAVAIADLSGLSKGEVERIWLPFVPFATLVVVRLASSRRAASWIAAQAAVAIALQTLLVWPW